jgi:hypothetical protein
MKVTVINQSTVVNDSDLLKAVEAIQIQVTRDFAPHYTGCDATLGVNLDSYDAYLLICDDSDTPGALGWHTDDDSKPYGKIFAKTDINDNLSWSVTLSHEILELLADPTAVLTSKNIHTGTEYAYEVCDACEDDEFAYLINDIKVSDFVLPQWFTGEEVEHYDYGQHLTVAGKLLPGGYISILEDEQWKDVTAELRIRNQRANTIRPDSRHDRRITLKGRPYPPHVVTAIREAMANHLNQLLSFYFGE